jgi:chromosome condensin MukBEF MukE localization factor
VDDLIFTGNNAKMFKDFKQAMIKEFEMMDIGLMTYYLGIEIKQEEYGIFVNQEKFIKEILKNFKMKDCAKVNTPIECGEKMSKNDKVEKINSTIFESVIRSLRYLICTYLDILFGVRHVSKFMETPITTHFKALKRIL